MSSSDVSGASAVSVVVSVQADVSGAALPAVDVSGAPAVDVSGAPASALANVFANPAVAQLLALLNDAVQKSPKTTADAIALFKTLSEKLVLIVVNDLPPEMKEAALKQLWIAKEVEAVCLKSCVGFSFGK